MFHPAIRLPDGRRLAYTEAGRPDGFPIVYLHGAIGSPLTGDRALVDTVEDMGLRLLIIQRPGFGESTPKPGRTLLDFADDVSAFADALGIDRFAIAGVSAGGPYAIACAHRLAPDRLTAVAAVSSLSPLGLPRRLRIIARAPRLTTLVGDAVTRHPVALRRALGGGGSALDAFLAATAGGVGGLVEDHLITQRAWGFELGAVAGQVHVWHGMADTFVPADHALQLAAALPNCTVSLDPGEGHFFFRRRVADILGDLHDHRRAAAVARPRLYAPAVRDDDLARDRQP
jgi:pimeloyl-ACP methyl ester carboxylesterase